MHAFTWVHAMQGVCLCRNEILQLLGKADDPEALSVGFITVLGSHNTVHTVVIYLCIIAHLDGRALPCHVEVMLYLRLGSGNALREASDN